MKAKGFSILEALIVITIILLMVGVCIGALRELRRESTGGGQSVTPALPDVVDPEGAIYEVMPGTHTCPGKEQLGQCYLVRGDNGAGTLYHFIPLKSAPLGMNSQTKFVQQKRGIWFAVVSNPKPEKE